MRKTLLWTTGFVLVLAALLGMAFAAAGWVAIRQFSDDATRFATDMLNSLNQSLATTADGLTLADQTLDATHATVGSLAITLNTTNKALSETIPTIDTVAAIVGKDVVNVVNATSEGLKASRGSMAAIDATFDSLSQVPLLNLGVLKPEVPLATSVQTVIDNLAPLPTALSEAERGIRIAATSARGIQANLADVSKQATAIQESVKAAKRVIGQYQVAVANFKKQLDNMLERLPGWMQTLRLALSLVLAWLGVAQLALLTQGVELMARARAKKAA